MKIFITGASGYIGNAVAKAFRRSGHTVLGLVRKESDSRKLMLNEIIPVMGDLKDSNSYLKTAEDAEVLVHCAFEYSPESISRDISTVDTLIKAAKKNTLPRTIIYTSGVWVYGNTGTKIVDEASPLNPLETVKWRPSHEEKVLNASTPQLKTIVIRPGCVYGTVGSLTKMWFDSIPDGSVPIAGKGENHWAMIHLDDLANAYVLAAEKELNRVVLNIIDQTTYTVKEMAEAIASTAGIPGKIDALSKDQSAARWGALAEGLLVDQMVSNERARRLLNWTPKHTGFIPEIKRYYDAWKADRELS